MWLTMAAIISPQLDEKKGWIMTIRFRGMRCRNKEWVKNLYKRKKSSDLFVSKLLTSVYYIQTHTIAHTVCSFYIILVKNVCQICYWHLLKANGGSGCVLVLLSKSINYCNIHTNNNLFFSFVVQENCSVSSVKLRQNSLFLHRYAGVVFICQFLGPWSDICTNT